MDVPTIIVFSVLVYIAGIIFTGYTLAKLYSDEGKFWWCVEDVRQSNWLIGLPIVNIVFPIVMRIKGIKRYRK
jgi:hypothetical protein